MIDNKIEELFNTIKESVEYNRYVEINNILGNNKEVLILIEEIKKLNKEATKLEASKNKRYKYLDRIIKEKTKLLKSNPSYQEYLNRMDELNDILTASSHLIEGYISEKI